MWEDSGWMEIVKQEPRKVAVRIHFGPSLWEHLKGVKKLTFHVFVEDLTTGHTRKQTVYSYLSRRVLLKLAGIFMLGHHYEITVNLTKPATSNVEPGLPIGIDRTLRYKETRRMSKVKALLDKAEQFSDTHEDLPVRFAYRNKSRQYFNQILSAQRKVMTVYPKSNNGDPGCPVNGEVSGLFFAVRPDPDTHNLPPKSPFGNRRMYLPVQKLIRPYYMNLYFADFWCHNVVHHVTLVVTKPNSTADQFCAESLPQLEIDDNPFIWNDGLDYFCCREPHVDLLYTEDIDLRADYILWETVRTVGQGAADPNGRPKRRDCTICNL